VLALLREIMAAVLPDTLFLTVPVVVVVLALLVVTVWVVRVALAA
jgi:hypothetical protein